MDNKIFNPIEKGVTKNAKESSKTKFLKYLRRGVLFCGLSYGLYTAKENMGIEDYSQYKTFSEAFGKARHDGEEKFEWNGKKYTTELVDKEISDLYFESKDFLNMYYSSDYFKSKLIGRGDTIDIYSDALNEDLELLKNSESAYGGIDPMSLSDLEFQEYITRRENLYGKNGKFRSVDSYASTQEFAERIEALKDSLASVYSKNLAAGSYFSITDKKGKGSPQGFYNRPNKHVFIHQDNPGKTDNITTSVHELSHKASDGDSMLLFTNDLYYTVLERYVSSLSKMSKENNLATLDKYDSSIIEYLASPTEIDARQNSTRFWLYKNFQGYTPATFFTGEHFDFLIENYDRLPSDVRQLVDVFPDRDFFVENMNLF